MNKYEYKVSLTSKDEDYKSASDVFDFFEYHYFFYKQIHVENGNIVIDKETIPYDACKKVLELGHYIVNGRIRPKLIINDELKKYLLLNRVVSKDDTNCYIVSFGKFLESVTLKESTETLIKKNGKKINNSFSFVQGRKNRFQTYSYNGEEYIRHKFKYTYREINHDIENWYKKSDLLWYLNPESNELVMSSAILSLFHVCKIFDKNIYKSLKFEDSLIGDYLTNKLIPEMLKNEEFLKEQKEEVKEENNEPTTINSKVKHIQYLIKGFENNDNYNKKLNDIIKNYNNGLEIYAKHVGKLMFGIKDEYALEQELNIGLDLLEKEIIENMENIKPYKEMLEYLTNVEQILNGNEELKKDEFLELLNYIVNVSINYLGEEIYKDKVKDSVLNKPRTRVNNYISSVIDGNENKIEFHNLDEFILYLRKEINPLLIEIADKINKKDINKDVMKSINSITSAHFETSQNRIIKIYISLINKVYSDLCSRMSYDDVMTYKDEIHNIIHKEINYDMEFDKICEELMIRYNALKNIYSKLFDIKDTKKRILDKQIKIEKELQ